MSRKLRTTALLVIGTLFLREPTPVLLRRTLLSTVPCSRAYTDFVPVSEDMQNYFEPMTTTAQLKNILKLSKLFSSHSGPQFFTQHGHPPSDFQPPITNQLVRKWGIDGSIHINTPDWELMPPIQSLLNHAKSSSESTSSSSSSSSPLPVVMSKNTYDAFWNTDLEEKLRDNGVERVVICGVMTDCCCDTTGRSAFNRGFETWMVVDACGSVSVKQHQAGLRCWGFGFGDVVDTDEVLKRLG